MLPNQQIEVKSFKVLCFIKIEDKLLRSNDNSILPSLRNHKRSSSCLAALIRFAEGNRHDILLPIAMVPDHTATNA